MCAKAAATAAAEGAPGVVETELVGLRKLGGFRTGVGGEAVKDAGDIDPPPLAKEMLLW